MNLFPVDLTVHISVPVLFVLLIVGMVRAFTLFVSRMHTFLITAFSGSEQIVGYFIESLLMGHLGRYAAPEDSAKAPGKDAISGKLQDGHSVSANFYYFH
ncbi:hypothetical protein AB833_07065 [Chromatiales bacterium (ex Bugula neritina AB1)]|nr:hypothetical protein AB833_07065 [Chromatiales bacterium (ex Bugula neritina AB1)]